MGDDKAAIGAIIFAIELEKWAPNCAYHALLVLEIQAIMRYKRLKSIKMA